jgi:hypothetical protein
VPTLATGLLAQTVDLTEAPTSVAAALFLILVGFITGIIRRGSECDIHKERAERLEAALDEERQAVLLAMDAIRELNNLGRLMRRVLEAMPNVGIVAGEEDDPPRPPPRRR